MIVTSRFKALALLSGTVIGFALAVTAGYYFNGSKPDHFKRFHRRISTESLFYPTFSTLENLARAKWSPGKTLVIIGGSSILRGNGQPEAELWSTRLQEKLGEHYVVVNLAFVGAGAGEAGALVAESMIRHGIPVIFVADSSPWVYWRAFGGIYDYLYWDALYKHRLLPFPARDAACAAWEKGLSPSERIHHDEIKRSERLDAILRFQSLWHYVAYRYCFTVWNSLIPNGFWRQRDLFPDDEPMPPPVEQRFHTVFDLAMGTVRSMTSSSAVSDGHGGWVVPQEKIDALNQEISQVFHPALRSRMMILLTKNCPYYLDRMTPGERQRDAVVFDAFQKIFRANGIDSAIVGQNFQLEDYVDRCHFSPDGGRKMAGIVAEQIHQLETR